MMRRGVGLAVALLALAATLALVSTAPARAQVLPPLPPLPPAPAEGSLLSDILGPSATSTCDAIATVEALAGPIISAQLAPELALVVEEVTPYLSLVSYVCSLVATKPTGNLCAADESVGDLFGVLGLPVNLPAPFQIGLDTAAGIEHVFLRSGMDIGTEVSRQLAAALGCAIPPPLDTGEAAPLPASAGAPTPPPPTPPAGPPAAPLGTFAPIGVPGAAGSPATTSVGPSIPGVIGLADVSYPVDGTAALLLALPLAGLGVAIALGPRLVPASRRTRRRSPG